MSRHHNVVVAVAAILTSAALIVPSSGLAAQSTWTVTHDRMPIVEGSGNIVRQNRSVGAFYRVDMTGSEVVEVRVGDRPSLTIAADDNILRFIETKVEGGTLKIRPQGSFRTRSPIRVWLTTPNLESLQSSGSGDVMIHGVNNNRLALTINGSADVRATGRTSALDLKIHGSGSARLGELAANRVDAGLYGSGSATVRAVRELDARVIGSGDLRYVGRPAQISPRVIGSGRITATN